jgi:signal transduction histidine kinase
MAGQLRVVQDDPTIAEGGMSDLSGVLLLTVVCCLAVGLVGVGVLRLLRGASLRIQVAIATVLPVLAVAASVAVNARLMFLSLHDSTVVLVALFTSLLLAAGGAALVLRRVSRARTVVGLGLSQLVADTSAGAGVPEPAAERGEHPADFADVLDTLALTRSTLAQVRQRERAAEQARRDLVGFISDDLRTPLSGLRALAEGLEDGVITDVPRALAQLRRTVSRMTVSVDDMVSLARIQGTHEAVRAADAGQHVTVTSGVVESHAGRIGVRSVEGGRRFDVLLPAPELSA